MMASHILTMVSSVLCLVTMPTTAMSITRTKFKAAVYEHAFVGPPAVETPVSRSEALQRMQFNLDVYRVQAQAAKYQGADILVFPEDGLYGYRFTRETIRPYLEYIPDPEQISWIACNDPNRFPDTEVQRQLSCMARDNSLYLVANMGDVQKCQPSTDRNCTSDGVLQYNTAVAFDPSGKLVARYHKRNLFFEFQFDRPENEVIYFDTPFGRFGLFICFDILFKSPALDMVQVHNISNVIFPTAWMDALPIFSSIGWHSSFARSQGVNFLSANLHQPSRRFQGSGIYTPDGMGDFYYNTQPNSGPKLIVKEIAVVDVPASKLESDDQADNPISGGNANLTSSVGVFDNDGFNFVTLERDSSNVTVCRNRICCALEYSFYNRSKTDLVVLGAFDGPLLDISSQICAVLKCPENNRTTCGNYTFVSDTSLERATLQAFNMSQSSPIFPQVVLSKDGQLQLTDSSAWSWSRRSKTLTLNQPLETPLVTMAIVARKFDEDPAIKYHA